MDNIQVKPRLIALDIDGTLIGATTRSMTKCTQLAILEAQRKGVRITLISGRPLAAMRNIILQLGLARFGGYFCACHSAEVYSAAKHRLIKRVSLSAENVRLLFHLIVSASSKLNIGAYCKDTLITYKRDKTVLEEAFFNGMVLWCTDDFEAAITEDTLNCVITGAEEQVARFVDFLHREYSSLFSVVLTRPGLGEVTASGADKGLGLKTVMRECGVPAKCTAAFGDGHNDIPMLKAAGTAVAMNNAVDELKSIADIVAPDADEDGVARMLFRWGLVDRLEQNESGKIHV